MKKIIKKTPPIVAEKPSEKSEVPSSSVDPMKDNIVMSKVFAGDLHAYLNSKPRAETNVFCTTLEQHVMTVGNFLKAVEEYNKKSPEA